MLHQVAQNALEQARPLLSKGAVADYIPELGKANPNGLGICIFTNDGQRVRCGDTETRFTIQSICKVISLSTALQCLGPDRVFSKVLMEPSGDAFNSIIKLDTADESKGDRGVKSVFELRTHLGKLVESHCHYQRRYKVGKAEIGNVQKKEIPEK